MAFFYTNAEVRIPPSCHPQKDGRVRFGQTIQGDYIKRTVGKVSRPGMMYPTDLYLRLFTKDFLEQYPDRRCWLHPDNLKVGEFALVLGISITLGLYQALAYVYGAKMANGIMDFAMYSLRYSSNVADSFATEMNEHMMFSFKPYEDSWYSEHFSTKMNERLNNEFRARWLQLCLDSYITRDVYISIDGSNVVCKSKESNLPQKGHDKTHSSSTIVSYIWIICSSGPHKGMPITYFIYEGSKVDSVALKRITAYLRGYKLNVGGAILDRGFCTKDCLDELAFQHIPYEVMMTSNTEGYKTMMVEHAEDIRNHSQYAMNEGGTYGITDKAEIFQNSEEQAYIALFYDDVNGAGERKALMDKVLRVRAMLVNNANKGIFLEIPSNCSNYLEYNGRANFIGIKFNELDKELATKGYSAIASSVQRTAQEINDIYNLRDAVEKTFTMEKTQLGYKALRGHTTDNIRNRFFVCFIASILRSEIINACKDLELDTNKTIASLDAIHYIYNGGRYEYADSLSEVQEKLFTKFNMTNDSIGQLVDLIQGRITADIEGRPQAHVWELPQKKKPGRKPKVAQFNLSSPCRFANMKVGGVLFEDEEKPIISENDDSLNLCEGSKTTNQNLVRDLNKESPITQNTLTEQSTAPVPTRPTTEQSAIPALEVEMHPGNSPDTNDMTTEPKIHRGPGRPPNSKNKKTLEMEESMAKRLNSGEEILYLPLPKRGRPKTEATLAKEEEERIWNYKADIGGVPRLELPARSNHRPTKEEREARKRAIQQWQQQVELAYSKAIGYI